MNPLERAVLLALVSAWLILILVPAAPAGTAVVKVISPGRAPLQYGANWRNELQAGDVVITTPPGWSAYHNGHGSLEGPRRDGQTIFCHYRDEKMGFGSWYSHTIKRQIIECKYVPRGFECTVKE